MARFVQQGAALDYTPSSAVAAGDVVLMGSIGIGIAQTAIAANVKGSLIVDGVIEHAKASGAVNAYAKVYWDNTAKVLTTTAQGNTLAGYAVAAAGANDPTAVIKLMKS